MKYVEFSTVFVQCMHTFDDTITTCAQNTVVCVAPVYQVQQQNDAKKLN